MSKSEILPTPGQNDHPKVSCLMVTADRSTLVKRAVRCFLEQNWPEKELVIIDDGLQDLEPVLRDVPSSELKYIRLEKKPENVLGMLRNLALQKASGEFLIQWDDDDWYHPERIAIQASVLMEGYDACCLSAAMMHLNTGEFMHHPYIGILPDGIPGSIMHRRDDEIRYPEFRRAEDTVYLKQWMKKRYTRLPVSRAHLFIRCYHGSNTWDQKHFLRRIRNSPDRFLLYIWYKYIRRDLFSHPRFRLDRDARSAFELYLKQSESMALL